MQFYKFKNSLTGFYIAGIKHKTYITYHMYIQYWRDETDTCLFLLKEPTPEKTNKNFLQELIPISAREFKTKTLETIFTTENLKVYDKII